MHNAQQHRRVRSNTLRGQRYTLQDMDREIGPAEIDKLSKGQAAKAAKLLMDHYYEREVTRSMPEVAKAYRHYKDGNYLVDLNGAGRTTPDLKPPPDWPFSEREWIMGVSLGQEGTLARATGYLIQERERLARKSEDLFSYGADAFDDEQRERMHKSRQKAAAAARRAWRERAKQGVDLKDGVLSLPISDVNSSTPFNPTTYANSIIDDMMNESIWNGLPEEVVEVNP